MLKNSKFKIIALITILVLCMGGLGFYGGMQYQKSQSPTMSNGSAPGGTPPTGSAPSAPVSGDIVSKDDTSITIDTDNGTKIIYYSDSTDVTSQTTKSTSDLVVGKNVVVNGTSNTDSSITAEMISIQ